MIVANGNVLFPMRHDVIDEEKLMQSRCEKGYSLGALKNLQVRIIFK